MIAIRRPPVKPHWESRISLPKFARILAQTMSAIGVEALHPNSTGNFRISKRVAKLHGLDRTARILRRADRTAGRKVSYRSVRDHLSAVIGFLFSLPARRGVSLAVL